MSALSQVLLRAAGCIVLLASVAAAQSPLLPSSSAAPAPRKVLFLFGEDINHPAVIAINKSLRSDLISGSRERIELYSEYLDVRMPLTDYENELLPLLRRRYEGRKFDLIFAIGAPALDVLLRRGDELFPKVPTVFCAVDRVELSGLKLPPRITGVFGEINFKANLDIALNLFPETRKIVVVAGVSDYDKFWLNKAKADFQSYEDRLGFEYLEGLTIDEQAKALSSLPNGTLVFFVSNRLDRIGNFFINTEVLAKIAPASSAPIFGTTDVQLGFGIVGGRLLSFEAIGSAMAQLGLQIMAGMDPQEIAPHGLQAVPMFDWQAMQRWGINERNLPTGSIVRNQQPTLWQLYSRYIIIAVVAVILETLLLAWLLVIHARRRQAEKDRESFARLAKIEQQRLKEVVANVPGVVWESRIHAGGKERKAEFVSQHVEQMLGYSVDEWLSTPGFALSIVHDDDREQLVHAIDNVLATGKEGILQYRWLKKDGQPLWVETHFVVIRDEQNKLVGLRGVTMDITERKLAEESLQRSEAKNQAILLAIPDLMFLQTPDGVFLDYHAKSPRDLLLPPAAFLGKNMRDVLSPTLSESLAACFRRAQETNEPQSLEFTMNLQGQERWFETRIVRTSDGNMLSMVRDITERKRAEEELKASEANYRTVFNAANDAIFVHDLETGAVLDVNERMCEMYGVTADEARQLNVGDLSLNEPPYTLEAALRWIERAASGEPQLFEWRAKDKSGRLFWVEVHLKRTFVRGKDVLLAVVRDITARKLVMDELRNSEERFARAFRSNPQPMSLTTIAGELYLDVNESFLEMSGYAREEVIGRTAAELNVWETTEAHSQFLNQLEERGSIVNLEARFRTKNGSLRVLLLSAEKLEIGGENCLLMASIDVTERVLAQQALRESEARFRNMADTAPVMIWMSDHNQHSTYFNKQWLMFTGRSIEQELGHGWTEGLHPDDRARCVSTFTSAFEKRDSFRMEYRLRAADGRFRWVYESATPRFSAAGEFLGYIGSAIDITDRRDAEEAVRAAKDELRLIADSLPVLISQSDSDGFYSFSNLAYESWFGRSREEIRGRHMRDVLGEDVWTRTQPEIEKALSGQEVHYETLLTCTSGEQRWVSVSEIPMRDINGEVNGVVSLMSDITESRRAQEILRDLSGRLIKAQEEERSRVARELHDDLSQRMALLSIELEQLNREISKPHSHLQLRIQKLLNVAEDISVEMHHLAYQLHPSKLDHLGLVAAVKSFCQELSERHGIWIDFQYKGFPASLSKDITLCAFRIVQEALHNIVKHSGAGEAMVVLEKSDDILRLSVSDAGCGFDTKSEAMTSGLGFVGMKERLRLVGGKLSIASDLGRGTLIEVSIPLTEQVKQPELTRAAGIV